MSHLPQDVRFAVRYLRKHPGFTLVTLLTLALGIGLNTAIFSGAYTLLLRPLPFAEPHRLTILREIYPDQDDMPVAIPNFLDWRDRSQSFEGLAAYRGHTFNLTGGDSPRRLTGAHVSANLFALLGLTPAQGRLFARGEEWPAMQRVAILGYGLWQGWFGGEDVVGRTLLLNGVPYTVVGALPIDFRLPSVGTLEIFLPLGTGPAELAERGSHSNLRVLGRLRPEVSLERAQAEMSQLAAALAQEHPETNAGGDVGIQFLHDRLAGHLRPALAVLWGAAALVLLIACVNVAHLLLARATGRRRELAVRTALGASRGRLLRQLLVETTLLSALGGAAGLLLAAWGIDLLRATMTDATTAAKLQLSLPGLLFALVLALATGILLGLVPAWRLSRLEAQSDLKAGNRARGDVREGRTRQLLAALEIALALVLSVSAALLSHSLLRLLEVDPGFEVEGVLSQQISLPPSSYPTPEARARFARRLLEEMEAVPGVAGAALSRSLPLTGNSSSTSIQLEGHPPPALGEPPLSLRYLTVSPSFFDTLGIPLLAGRTFLATDGVEAAPVALINDVLAERFWPGESPLGKRMTRGPREITVVGVVEAMRDQELTAAPDPMFYLPLAQNPESEMTLAVRAFAEPEALAPAVRQVVGQLDPDLPLTAPATLEEILRRAASDRCYPAMVLGGLAALAVLLAALGIYGVLSYSTSQRIPELGLRMALGARRRAIVGMVLGQGLRVTGAGVALGTLAALAVARLLRSLLFEVEPTDPLSFGAVALLLTGVALLACLLPARRAGRIHPMECLRDE